jgi:hypothetical protein
MFIPSTVEPDLYQKELIRLGHPSWIKPLQIWFNNRLPLAWMLVCQGCDPRVQLLQALEQFTTTCEEWQLLEAIIGLEINKVQLSLSSAVYEPTIESFEQFVWRTGEVTFLKQLSAKLKADIQLSLVNAFSAARLETEAPA